jgi:hypothetical protein
MNAWSDFGRRRHSTSSLLSAVQNFIGRRRGFPVRLAQLLKVCQFDD